MGKLDAIKTAIEIAKLVSDSFIAHRDERARREKEKREAEEKEKDRRIAELERQLKEKATP